MNNTKASKPVAYAIAINGNIIDLAFTAGEALERFGKYEAPGKKIEALPLIVDPAYRASA